MPHVKTSKTEGKPENSGNLNILTIQWHMSKLQRQYIDQIS